MFNSMSNNNYRSVCPYFTPEFNVIPQYITMEPGESMELNDKISSYLLFVQTGAVFIDFDLYTNRPVVEGELFFLPKNISFKWRAAKKTMLLLTGFNMLSYPCTSADAGVLYRMKADFQFKCKGIAVKPELQIIFDQMKHYLESDLKCHHIFFLKQKEIYLIFKHYYTNEEITELFYLSMGRNPLFTDLVLDNYLKVKTAKELANLLGYGIKTFEKLFKANFDETPYKWMQTRRALQIKQKLMNRSIPFKQIMLEFDFSTSSHFNIYCKRYLGNSPIHLRNSNPDDPPSIF